MTAVAGLTDEYTTNSAPSDVNRRSGNRQFRCYFYRRDLYRKAGAAGRQIAQKLRKRVISAPFSFEIRLHKLPHARAMYKFDAHWRAAASLGARLDFTIVDILDAMFQSEQSFPHYKFGQIPAKVHRCSQP